MRDEVRVVGGWGWNWIGVLRGGGGVRLIGLCVGLGLGGGLLGVPAVRGGGGVRVAELRVSGGGRGRGVVEHHVLKDLFSHGKRFCGGEGVLGGVGEGYGVDVKWYGVDNVARDR